MNRMTGLLTALLLGISAAAFAQKPQPPQSPDDVASQQLIAWTWMQKPQPMPLPPRDTPIPQADPQAQQSADPQAQAQKTTQTFTGKIVKNGSLYVLKVAGIASYQLDQQSGLAQYENQEVKVTGSLDADSNTIRVVKMELLS